MDVPMAAERRMELSSRMTLSLFCIVVVFTCTSTVSVLLRVYAKRLNKMRLMAEDYTIFVAQIFVYGFAVCCMLQIFMGSVGHHANTVPRSHIANFLKILVAVQVLYGVAVGLVKISICLFYIRIFFTRKFRIAGWILMITIALWTVVITLNALLICSPLAYNWDIGIEGGRCANKTVAYTLIGAIDLLTDIALFALPVPMIYNLHVSRLNKIALFGVFGLGVSTMVLALLRVITLPKVSYDDVTYTACEPLIWSFLEPAIGVTVACGPIMGPLFKANRFIKSLSNRSKSSGRGERDFDRLKEPAHQLAVLPPRKTTTTTSSDEPIIIQSPDLLPARPGEDLEDARDGGKYV